MDAQARPQKRVAQVASGSCEHIGFDFSEEEEERRRVGT
jgi:hypothetical protein